MLFDIVKAEKYIIKISKGWKLPFRLKFAQKNLIGVTTSMKISSFMTTRRKISHYGVV